MESKGRPKGYKKKTIKLLDYRNWIIEVDNNFPSFNYVVRKKDDISYHRVAYCGSLESALKHIYQIMLCKKVRLGNFPMKLTLNLNQFP